MSEVSEAYMAQRNIEFKKIKRKIMWKMLWPMLSIYFLAVIAYKLWNYFIGPMPWIWIGFLTVILYLGYVRTQSAPVNLEMISGEE